MSSYMENGNEKQLSNFTEVFPIQYFTDFLEDSFSWGNEDGDSWMWRDVKELSEAKLTTRAYATAITNLEEKEKERKRKSKRERERKRIGYNCRNTSRVTNLS